MLYYLLPPLAVHIGALNVTRYITFRTAAASLSALALSLIFGPPMIRKLRELHVGQNIREDGPQSHQKKAGTPTFGGLMIWAPTFIVTAVAVAMSVFHLYTAYAIVPTQVMRTVHVEPDVLSHPVHTPNVDDEASGVALRVTVVPWL